MPPLSCLIILSPILTLANKTSKIKDINIKYMDYKKIAKINKDSLQLLTLNNNFIKEVIFWRKKIGIPKNGFKKEKTKDMEKLYKDETRALLVSKATNTILKDFKLSINYDRTIMGYLLYNKIYIAPLNHSINLKGDYVNVEIYSKPTKEEWIAIKNEINGILGAIQRNNYKFLEKFNYPNGNKSLRPKRTIERDLKILKKINKVGTEIIDPITRESSKYTLGDVEAEIFPEGNIKQSKRNRANIRTIKHRKRILH
jgi:hypothetical protein